MSIHDARARYTRMVIREQFLMLLKEKNGGEDHCEGAVRSL